jgi:hypothetical protein
VGSHDLILAGGTLIFARTPVVRPWTILAVVFLVLSLGPTLQVGGYRLLSGLMPGRWLFEIVPYLNLSRSPIRFLILAQLCMAVIAAFGLSVWLSQVRDRLGRTWQRVVPVVIGTVVALLLLWEYDGGDIGLTAMTVPPVYSEVAGDPSIRTVCELPISDKLQIGNWYMYWQTFHGRKTANGYLSRPSKSARPLVDRIRGWQTLGPGEIQELIDAEIDAVVYHDPYQESQLIRLRETDASERSPNGE